MYHQKYIVDMQQKEPFKMMKAAEASGKTTEERRAERRQKAVVGPLPESFLRIPGVNHLHDRMKIDY